MVNAPIAKEDRNITKQFDRQLLSLETKTLRISLVFLPIIILTRHIIYVKCVSTRSKHNTWAGLLCKQLKSNLFARKTWIPHLILEWCSWLFIPKRSKSSYKTDLLICKWHAKANSLISSIQFQLKWKIISIKQTSWQNTVFSNTIGQHKFSTSKSPHLTQNSKWAKVLAPLNFLHFLTLTGSTLLNTKFKLFVIVLKFLYGLTHQQICYPTM